MQKAIFDAARTRRHQKAENPDEMWHVVTRARLVQELQEDNKRFKKRLGRPENKASSSPIDLEKMEDKIKEKDQEAQESRDAFSDISS